MDIVSRLKEFLRQMGISNSQFADTCEIPRPTLSQLLTGRNKKVSDEFISKIHRAYPTLNIMWLMFGDGDMFSQNVGMTQSNDFAQLPENGTPASDSKSRKAAISFDDESYNQSKQRQPVSQPQMLNEAFQSMMRTTASPSRRGAVQQSPAASSASERHVVSIMVLYSDGRFETFKPQ